MRPPAPVEDRAVSSGRQPDLPVIRMVARADFPDGVFAQCDRQGFVARSSGAARRANPYDSNPACGATRPSSIQVEQRMASAWWAGWDRADRQLLSGSRLRA
jgi:hypothetical protein